MSDAFYAFSNVNALQYNPYTQPLWMAAVAQFDRAVAPAEQRIAGKLRAQIRGLDSNPHQLLHEFERYRELVRRPSLAKELITERFC
jgi:dynein heavy chain 2